MVPWSADPPVLDAPSHWCFFWHISRRPKQPQKQKTRQLLPICSADHCLLRAHRTRWGLWPRALHCLGSRVDRHEWGNHPNQGVFQHFPHRHALRWLHRHYHKLRPILTVRVGLRISFTAITVIIIINGWDHATSLPLPLGEQCIRLGRKVHARTRPRHIIPLSLISCGRLHTK